MHPSAVRCVLGRGRPGIAVVRRDLGTSARTFSASQPRVEDSSSSDKPAPPSRQQRSAAAASELSSLPKSSPAAAPRPVDARALAAGRAGNPSSVISVRSLPRRADGKPFFRRTPGGPGGAAGEGNNRPRFPFRPRFGAAGPGGPRAGGPGGPRAGGPGGPRGGARGPGGMRRGPGKPRRKERRDKEGGNEKFADRKLSADEQAWVDSVEQGVATTYKPATTLESLIGHAPAVAMSGKLARVETAMRDMRLLGAGKPFVADSFLANPQDAMKRYRLGRPVFLSHPDEGSWVREIASKRTEPLGAATEVTRKTVVELGIRGAHAAPKSPARTDVLGTLQSYHLRSSTYKPEDGKALDAKVQSLLPGQGAGAGKGQQQKQARA